MYCINLEVCSFSGIRLICNRLLGGVVVAYGYHDNNSGNFRKYDGYKSSYRGSSRNVRRRRSKRTRNRIIIVATGIIILALIITLISTMFSCICSSCKSSGSTISTETVSAKKKSKTTSKKKTTTNTDYLAPEVEDTDKHSTGVLDGGLYIWNQKAFEMFYGGDSEAETYADLMNTAAKKLGSGIKVYSMIIPNHSEMGLPARLKTGEDAAPTTSQADYTKAAYAKMNKNVTPINIYNNLSQHCNEYIYFNGDHHWTGLGAYYAYEAYAKQLGLTPVSLADCTENVIEGFVGTLVKMTSQTIADDEVHYWDFPYTITDTVTDESGNVTEHIGPYYDDAAPGELTYGVFLFGDNPLEVLTSSSETASSEKLLVVHESYGNALVPYFTANYSEVYSIDFRSWTGNLKEFCDENGITNVLFANGVMSSATALQTDAIAGLMP